jgi:hypothetical protein
MHACPYINILLPPDSHSSFVGVFEVINSVSRSSNTYIYIYMQEQLGVEEVIYLYRDMHA